ncbi:ESPR-type extended signal peptide-containing protein, partial [Pseudomonas sp. Xaverov 259]|uniref:ESPR-type extended signal peptide-containing protein n=1 Tax=Pseudomonas sp. Xaverov 259 TaxID=2666086 RepID=UPI0034D56C2A
MNKIFSIVWNSALGCWVVASELAFKKTKSGPSKGKLRAISLIVGVVVGTTSAISIAATAMQNGAVGNGTAAGTSSVADATADVYSIAIGGGNGATATNISVAIGDASVATGSTSLALGRLSSATAENASAVGSSAVASALNAVAVGRSTSATAENASALGSSAVASALNAVAVGRSTSATAENASALGAYATASAVGAVAVGGSSSALDATQASGVGAVAVGTSSRSFGPGNIAIGQSAIAGVSGSATVLGATAVGRNAIASNRTSTAVGSTAVASGVSASAFGVNALAGGSSSVAIGQNSAVAAGAVAGIAVGFESNASGVNAMALGREASATVTNSVALGYGASTAAAVATTGGRVNGTTYNYAGAAPIGVLSVGSAGNERQINNVAAGRVTATSTDAVNGSQLFATETAVNVLGGQLTEQGSSSAARLGGGSTYDAATGTVSAPTYTVQGATSNTVGDAIGAVDGNLTTLNSDISSGTVGVLQRNGTTDETVLTALTGTSAAPGSAQKLRNLANGELSETSLDAINGSQLFGTNTLLSQVGTSTATNLGGGSTYDAATGTVSAPTYTVQGATSNTVGDAIGAVDSNLTTLNSDISSGTVGVLQRNDTTDETVLTALTGTSAAPGSAQKLRNLANGELSETSLDAINGSQLFGTTTLLSQVGTSTATNLGGGSTYDAATGTV